MTIKQTIKKLRKFDIIRVYWEDITSDCSWMTEDKIKEFETSKCHTIGFFLGRVGDSIKLSYSYDFEMKCGAVEIIPIGVILEIHRHGNIQ
jgi:hypothetical protein